MDKKPSTELRIALTKSKTRNMLEKELINEGFSCYTWTDQAGAYYSPHSHEYDECICVLSGKISFFINNKEYKLETGKKLYLPAGIIHEAQNKSNEKVTYIIGELIN